MKNLETMNMVVAFSRLTQKVTIPAKDSADGALKRTIEELGLCTQSRVSVALRLAVSDDAVNEFDLPWSSVNAP